MFSQHSIFPVTLQFPHSNSVPAWLIHYSSAETQHTLFQVSLVWAEPCLQFLLPSRKASSCHIHSWEAQFSVTLVIWRRKSQKRSVLKTTGRGEFAKKQTWECKTMEIPKGGKKERINSRTTIYSILVPSKLTTQKKHMRSQENSIQI